MWHLKRIAAIEVPCTANPAVIEWVEKQLEAEYQRGQNNMKTTFIEAVHDN
jgi:hypothetical protein